jgi:hypothetical protein
MQGATNSADQGPLVLKQPTALSGKPAWFEEFYVSGSQKERDRKLFAH